MIIRRRAGVGMAMALLLQVVFLIPFDRRPAWALMGFLALWGLAGWLFLVVFPNNTMLWRKWRQALASPAMLLGLGFILYGAGRWSAMLVPYAGRVWVIATAWLGVGLALGSMLGALDRAGEPEAGRAVVAFRRMTILAAIALGLVRFYTALHHGALPSPAHLALLLVACIVVALAGESESPNWRIAAGAGALITGVALVCCTNMQLAPGMPDNAGYVYWPLFFDHFFWGAGPGALTLFIGNRESLAAAAPALEAWRWRVPAEAGVIGVVLAGAFVVNFIKTWPGRGPGMRAAEQRFAIVLALCMMALGAAAPGMGRPEAMALIGTVAGIGIGLDATERKVRAYGGRLVTGVCALTVVGAMALAMLARNQVAWRWHLRGDNAMVARQWDTAKALYGKAQAWQPDAPEHWIGEARAWAQIPEWVGNVSPYLVRAGHVDPWRPGVKAELAQWMAARGRWAEAEVEMREAFALDPTNTDYKRDIGRYKARATPRPKPSSVQPQKSQNIQK